MVIVEISDKKEMNMILSEFKKLFSGIGELRSIKLKNGAIPVAEPSQKILLAFKIKLKKIL